MTRALLVAALATVAQAAGTNFVYVCDPGTSTYSKFALLQPSSISCNSLLGTSMHYRYNEASGVFTTYANLADCTASKSATKTTTLGNVCQEVTPAGTYKLSLLVESFTCFPKECAVLDPCTSSLQANCKDKCSWDGISQVCRNNCYNQEATQCGTHAGCSTDSNACLKQLGDALAASASFSTCLMVVLGLCVCACCLAIIAAIVFAVTKRSPAGEQYAMAGAGKAL